MDDRELAIEIGKKIIALRHENAGLKAILNLCRDQQYGAPLQWKPMLEETMRGTTHSVDEETAWLERLIDNPSDRSSLVHKIHQHMDRPTEWD